MKLRFVFALAGAAFVAVGAAHADETTDDRAAVAAETPWYERFTLSQSPDVMAGGAVGPDDQRDRAGWRVNGRWGVTVDVNRSARPVAQAPAAPRDQTAVGAYFQFTPTMRVGGQVSVAPAQSAVGAPRDEESTADVRIQSAFRF